MDPEREDTDLLAQHDYQAAYIFDPENGETPGRPSKKRRVSKQTKVVSSTAEDSTLGFVPLLNGAERPDFVKLRAQLYRESWGKVESRIQDALRESNSVTLDQVATFVGEAKTSADDKIPSAFIITGSNLASQNLLFEQLSESLQAASKSKFVRLRSSEAVSLRAMLKKIIREVTDGKSDSAGEDLQMNSGQDIRRQYLDYDLEALHAYIKTDPCEHIFIAFEDSEGFESGLLCDLIPLFNAWRSRVPFTLLFGVATSTELLQARLLKSVCQQIYGAQFDAVQSGSILENVFKIAVAAADVPVRIGGPLLRSMLERQQDQVAGIQSFVSSLKYAYMCHFYANALSPILAAPDHGAPALQAEHVEALQNSSSFQIALEKVIAESDVSNVNDLSAFFMQQAANLATDCGSRAAAQRQTWVSCALRGLEVLRAVSTTSTDFSQSYVEMMTTGISPADDTMAQFTDRVRRMDAGALLLFIGRVIEIYTHGDEELKLGPSSEAEHAALLTKLTELTTELTLLQKEAETKGISLHSKYSGHNTTVRTTVIRQRVHLSKDTTALSEEDKQMTRIVDDTIAAITASLDVVPPNEVFLAESWLYDSKAPSRDVFVPRPRVVFERSLARPSDYLACECCTEGHDGVQPTLPTTSILYQMYLETGSLINVADLWTAFHAAVSKEEEDERKVLVLFYRALAELRALGFVKGSKRKADHVAKLKWL
ncbi:origin recognition complex subunit 3 N-terminus-domain-containing protein [Emericellopsis atlantica]|uniref:Origin recognition complex subunit 3 N-terminus-domain-containing protein n=1 Tax=Emericellopsis atlantica TaxID=2614577 RepID=A0A9P7ZNT2_9HYPO|nr:origin recognition complex subunit 3 N-terminus-domain-containing protein [Emericellopsis atlantica]KAG9255112.1 origin recognition complex subunit 3 N-terminus-domain-containing protein [Emericellopsis atlantica]